MNYADRKALRTKHRSWGDNCVQCETPAPCDATQLLDYLDLVEPMPPSINWQGGK